MRILRLDMKHEIPSGIYLGLSKDQGLFFFSLFLSFFCFCFVRYSRHSLAGIMHSWMWELLHRDVRCLFTGQDSATQIDIVSAMRALHATDGMIQKINDKDHIWCVHTPTPQLRLQACAWVSVRCTYQRRMMDATAPVAIVLALKIAKRKAILRSRTRSAPAQPPRSHYFQPSAFFQLF
jgi:hypothetical protein